MLLFQSSRVARAWLTVSGIQTVWDWDFFNTSGATQKIVVVADVTAGDVASNNNLQTKNLAQKPDSAAHPSTGDVANSEEAADRQGITLT